MHFFRNDKRGSVGTRVFRVTKRSIWKSASYFRPVSQRPTFCPIRSKTGCVCLSIRCQTRGLTAQSLICSLKHLNAAGFTDPGTTLRLVYSIAGEAETPNLAPDQNPADPEF